MLNVIPPAQPLIDLQAGGALLTVAIYLWLTHMDHLDFFEMIVLLWSNLGLFAMAYLRSATNSSIRAICFSTLSLAGPP